MTLTLPAGQYVPLGHGAGLISPNCWVPVPLWLHTKPGLQRCGMELVGPHVDPGGQGTGALANGVPVTVSLHAVWGVFM